MALRGFWSVVTEPSVRSAVRRRLFSQSLLFLTLLLSCLLHRQPLSERLFICECMWGVCLWTAKCPSNEDSDGERASLAISSLMTDFYWAWRGVRRQVHFHQQVLVCPPLRSEKGDACCFRLETTAGLANELHILLKTNKRISIIHPSHWCNCVI